MDKQFDEIQKDLKELGVEGFEEYTIEEIMAEETSIWDQESYNNNDTSGQMDKYDIEDPGFGETVSEDIDLLGGVEEVRKRTGKDLSDDWEQTAGEELLYSQKSEQSMGDLEYPLLLLRIVTEEMFDKVKGIIDDNDNGEPATFLTQIGDVAVNMGKGKLEYGLFRRLKILGLNPIYYEKQGEVKEYTAIEFFDPSEYEPYILEPMEEEEEEEQVISEVLKETRQEMEELGTKGEIDSVDRVESELVDLEWEKGIEESEKNYKKKDSKINETEEPTRHIPIELMTAEEREEYEMDKEYEDIAQFLGDLNITIQDGFEIEDEDNWEEEIREQIEEQDKEQPLNDLNKPEELEWEKR